MSSFCSAKATHIFSAKNIRILCIESAKTVNEMTLNELVRDQAGSEIQGEVTSPSRQNWEKFYRMREKSRLGSPIALLKARQFRTLDPLYCIVLGIFTILSWELTKKETNFTVDLFILTSKPIK